ncbi:MAG: ABC transporter permease, partial [Bellilinea sp.]
KTLKYMYVAPIRFPLYLVGRAVARFLTGSFSVLITIVFGVLFLHVPIDIARVDWLLFVVSLVVGVILLASMGLILAGFTLLLARHGDYLGDAVAGGLYLFSGAVFPLDVLPAWLRPLGYAMPITYWLELLRRSLVGSVAQAFPTLAAYNNLQLLGILVAMTAGSVILSVMVFRFCDHHARERGYIDMTTNY